MDHARIAHLTGQREQEWAEMQAYLGEPGCKMTYLRKALDDSASEACGKCDSCFEHPVLDVSVDSELAHNAAIFLKHAEMPIIPKAQVAANAFEEYGFRGNFPMELRAEEGRVLSRWGDAGWGKAVKTGKYANHFEDALVDAMAQMILQRWKPDPSPTWICYVPSKNHPDLVPDFATRLATQLDLVCIDAIIKVKDNHPQKDQQNRFHQCQNLDGAFEITSPVPDGPVLLVDDIIDSGWTLAVLTALLLQAGSGPVYPVALASSSVND